MEIKKRKLLTENPFKNEMSAHIRKPNFFKGYTV